MICRTSVVFFLFGLPVLLSAQITLDPVAMPVTCPGASLQIGFQSSDTFTAGNTFYVELSDALGSFATPVIIGSSATTIPGSISCTSFGTADGSGYRIRVRSTMPVLVSAASTEVLAFPTPDAGTGASLALCGLVGSMDLSTLLVGTPDSGGTWTVVSGSGIFADPNSGLYTGFSFGQNEAMYTVQDNGCQASANVLVLLVEPPNVGTNATLTVCSDDAPFSMFQFLGGVPSPGGVWGGPSGTVDPDLFDPAVDLPGVYTYVVSGTPPCANATSTLMISVSTAPDAGTDASHTLCTSDGPFDMFQALGGTPQAGGVWTLLGASHSPIYDPTTDGSGNFLYTVAGVAPCTSASATLMVQENNCFGGSVPVQCNCPVE